MALVSNPHSADSPRRPWLGGIAGLLAGASFFILAAMEPDMVKPGACAGFCLYPLSRGHAGRGPVNNLWSPGAAGFSDGAARARLR